MGSPHAPSPQYSPGTASCRETFGRWAAQSAHSGRARWASQTTLHPPWPPRSARCARRHSVWCTVTLNVLGLCVCCPCTQLRRALLYQEHTPTSPGLPQSRAQVVKRVMSCSTLCCYSSPAPAATCNPCSRAHSLVNVHPHDEPLRALVVHHLWALQHTRGVQVRVLTRPQHQAWHGWEGRQSASAGICQLN